MNAQEAIAKLKSAGGDFGKLSAVELYDVFRALQGSFAYSDELAKLVSYTADKTGKAKGLFANEPSIQRELVASLKAAESVEDFRSVYDAVVIFGDKTVKNKAANQAFVVLENYGLLNTFSPDELDDVIRIAENVQKDIKGKLIEVTPEQNKFVAEVKQRAIEEEKTFVLVNSLEELEKLSREAIDASMVAAEKANSDLAGDKKFTEQKEELDALLNTIEIEKESKRSKLLDNLANDETDNLTTVDFKNDARVVIEEEALRKCSLVPGFAKKKPAEQRKILMDTKLEVAEEFIKKSLLSQAVYNAGTKVVDSWKVSKEDKESFKKDIDVIVGNLRKDVKASLIAAKEGKTLEKPAPKVVLSKEVALANLVAAEKELSAVAKYIAKKTGFTKFVARAKAIKENFETKYPKTYAVTKGLGKAALKGGAVLGASALFAPAGALVSATFATAAAVKAWKNMKKEYKKDEKYKDKSFGSYLWDHKLDTTVAGLTAVSAGVTGFFGVAALGSAVGAVGSPVFEAATRRILRGAASGTVGLASGVNKLVKSKTKKDRWVAGGMMAASAGIAAVSMFFGEDIARWAGEKFRGFSAFKPAEGSNTPVENVQQPSGNQPVVADTTKYMQPSGKVDSLINNGSANQFMKYEDFSKALGEKFAWGQVKDSTSSFFPENGHIGVDRPYHYEQVNDPSCGCKSYVKVYDGDASKGTIVSRNEAIKLGLEKPTEVSGNGGANTELASTEKGTKSYTYTGESQISSRQETRTFKLWGEARVKGMYAQIDNGNVMSIPEGMSKEAYIYKLTQLMQLAPVVHKESIELMLLDIDCDKQLTAEQIKQIHESLKTIDLQRGDYHGYEPTARTCNVTTSLNASVKCADGSVNTSSDYIKGNCGGSRVTENVITETVVKKTTIDTEIKAGDPIDDKKIEIKDGGPIETPEEKAPEKTPEKVPEEKAPVETPKPKDASYDEINENASNTFSETAVDQGFKSNGKGGFEYVGKEEATQYVDSLADKYASYGKKMVDTGWAVPISDKVSAVTGDSVDKAFTNGIVSKDLDVFVVKNEAGAKQWYCAGGGEMHKVLAEKYPDQYAETYKNYQEDLGKYGTAKDPDANATTTNAVENAETSKRVSTADIVSMKKGMTK